MKRNAVDIKLFDETYDDPFHSVPIDLRHLIPGFLERRQKEIQELHEMLERNDFRAIQDIAHKLKGSGAGYGFDQISDIGSKLEKAAIQHNSEKARESVAQLVTIIEILRKRLV